MVLVALAAVATLVDHMREAEPTDEGTRETLTAAGSRNSSVCATAPGAGNTDSLGSADNYASDLQDRWQRKLAAG
jgi:hypothetical protein